MMIGETFGGERWWSGVLFPGRHTVVCREASIPHAGGGGKREGQKVESEEQPWYNKYRTSRY